MPPLAILFAAIALAWALTGLLLLILGADTHKQAVNARSMHREPTPVGGGLAIVAALVAIVAWQSLGTASPELLAVLAGAVALSALSAFDHYRPLWPVTRLSIQAVAVAISLSLLPETVRFVPSIDPGLERTAIAVAWLWMINLTNFMDGIDGIASAQAASVGLGIVGVLWLRTPDANVIEATVALALCGASLGFLGWNWSPARIFMGDAGSIPIGFLLGWLLIKLAATGAWAEALVLPILFVADATITLLRRIARGLPPWQAHRMHFYQRAVLGGTTAPEIVGFMTVCNVVIVLMALTANNRPLELLTFGVLAAMVFLLFLSARATPPPR